MAITQKITACATAFTIVLMSVSLSGCVTGADNPGVKVPANINPSPWTSLKLNNDPNTFRFAVVTDRAGGIRPGVFETAVEKLNILQPEFVLSIGDLINGDEKNQAEVEREYDEFKTIIAKLTVPFFAVPGNHDLKSDMMVKEWQKHRGPTYYDFRYRDVLFLCVDSEDPPATHISDAQVAYMKKAIDANKDARWIMVFLHKPLWDFEEDSGWNKFEALLKGRPHTVFAGHRHDYMKYTREDGSKYYVLATTGGSSKLRGPEYGEFDEVVWVTMTDKGPVIANLLLSGILDENVRVAEPKK